jgi:hypothetical protein
MAAPLTLAAATAYGAAPMLNWLVEERGIAPHIPVNDKSKRTAAPSRAATFDMIQPATSTTDRAESSLGQVAPCMRARRFCIASASSAAMYARSNPRAAQKSHHARSHVISTSMPATSPDRSLAPRTSSSRGASARRSRCGLRTSSAS